MYKLIFTRMWPGTGKTTLAQSLCHQHQEYAVIYSTDDYWLRPDGIYDFNRKLLGNSHAWNRQRVLRDIEATIQTHIQNRLIIVDNTNITFDEMLPYVKMAIKYQFDVEFMEPNTPWRYDLDECFKRNKHNVPKATIKRMMDWYESSDIVYAKYNKLLETHNE